MSFVKINNAALQDEIRKNTNYIAKDVNKIKDMRFKEEILRVAAPHIQALLKMASSLPTKDGLRQFYDTQSDIAKKNKGWKIPKNTMDPHLMEMWEVGYEVGKGGHGFIIVSNDKLVKGRSTFFSLFELLWEGTEYYVVPVQPTGEELARMGRAKGRDLGSLWRKGRRQGPISSTFKYKAHILPDEWKRELTGHSNVPIKKKWEGHATSNIYSPWANQEIPGFQDTYKQKTKVRGRGRPATGQSIKRRTTRRAVLTEVTDEYTFGGYGALGSEARRMSFYNRFKGRFYYNQFMRKGIEGETLQDFHDYITTCIYRGIMYALGQTEDASRKKAMMDALEQERFLRT